MKNVIFPSSHWGSNIGNAFFHLGNIHILNQSSPSFNVIPFDLRSEKAFMPSNKQMEFDSLYYQNVEAADYLLLDGPMFDLNFEYLFSGVLKKAKDSGTKIVLMSAGGIDYSDEEAAHCRKVLEKYRPFILTTRDSETYETYKEYADYSYDAICGAWFCPDFFSGIDTPNFSKYVSLCFDHAVEPELILDEFSPDNNMTWDRARVGQVAHRKLDKLMRLAKRGGYPASINGYDIIRPSHQVLHRANWRLYFKEMSFFSQTPWGYLNIYRNTSLTVTDRLHAAVATLAYGNPARLIIKSNRAKLLNRVGVQEVGKRICALDMELIEREKNAYIEWMRNVLES